MVLKWVELARRPLTIAEIREAISIKPGDSALHFDRLVESSLVVARCSNLVTLDRYDLTVRLTHKSVSKWFQGIRDWSKVEADIDLGVLCLVYLKFDIFRGQIVRKALTNRVDIRYSAQSMFRSALELPIVSKYLKKPHPSSSSWFEKPPSRVTLAVPPLPRKHSSLGFDSYQLLEYVGKNYVHHMQSLTPGHSSWADFKEIVLDLSSSLMQPPWSSTESATSQLHTMLNWAVRNNHLGLLFLIAEDQSVKDAWLRAYKLPWTGDGLPALHAAIQVGSGIFKRTALIIMAEMGELDYVDAQDRTALRVAVEIDDLKSAQYLLAKGANPALGASACLSLAAKTGNIGMFRLFDAPGNMHYGVNDSMLREVVAVLNTSKFYDHWARDCWIEFDPLASTIIFKSTAGHRISFPPNLLLSLAFAAAHHDREEFLMQLAARYTDKICWDRKMHRKVIRKLSDIRSNNKNWLYRYGFLRLKESRRQRSRYHESLRANEYDEPDESDEHDEHDSEVDSLHSMSSTTSEDYV